jgi:hypothetical protein
MIRASIFGVVVLAVIAAGTAAYKWAEANGVAKNQQDVQEQNDEAGQAAGAADANRAECNSLERMFWDFSTGKCRRATGSGG